MYFRVIRAVMIAVLAVGALPTLFSVPAVANEATIEDFMIMDVCTDAQNKILPATAPGMSSCLRHRNVASGEALPYHLHDFPKPNSTACKTRLGSLSKDNIPIVKNGVERIVSFYDRGVDHSCPDAHPDDPTFNQFDGASKEGGSLQYFDKEYGFIMGSWSTVSFSYWRTPLCAVGPDTSQRFMRGWVIAPFKLPPLNAPPGWGTFESKLENGDPNKAKLGCPESFNTQFTSWVRSNFTFKSGVTFDTLISDHYSRASSSKDGPGASEQMERTYWTNEFGLSRWEKWARDDWQHPRNGQSALELGKKLVQSGSCSNPFHLPEHVTPELSTTGSTEQGVYAEVLRNSSTGETHTWYMTLCRDYSNVVLESGMGTVPPWGGVMSDVYWK